ncbi:MAG: veratrol--corrinoid protein metyltransferase [Eubacteriaceae bacterium]|nr:veratrol--corrinoid protein metyltransferase [Eubacteriaceae bacterium]
MAKLSNKENLMLLLNKQIPEAIPTYSLFWGMNGSPSFTRGRSNPDGTGKDYFGVEWVIDNSAFQAALPKPGDFILDDIRDWRDVIKVPDYSNIDWEEAAKKDSEARDPELPVGGGTGPGVGWFQSLMSFMGFTNGLIACYEEPEEVKALMEYLTDFAVANAEKYVQYYKPDYGSFGDDIAHERDPFVSLETFRELFAPSWRRYAKVFVDAGIPVVHHNCGHFELFCDDLADMGVTLWEPVQLSNDVVAHKEKFGTRLALGGAFTSTPLSSKFDLTEEEVRAYVKDRLDILAPGGGYAWTFAGAILGDDSPVAQMRAEWVKDEFEKLRYTYYQ